MQPIEPAVYFPAFAIPYAHNGVQQGYQYVIIRDNQPNNVDQSNNERLVKERPEIKQMVQMRLYESASRLSRVYHSRKAGNPAVNQETRCDYQGERPFVASKQDAPQLVAPQLLQQPTVPQDVLDAAFKQQVHSFRVRLRHLKSENATMNKEITQIHFGLKMQLGQIDDSFKQRVSWDPLQLQNLLFEKEQIKSSIRVPAKMRLELLHSKKNRNGQEIAEIKSWFAQNNIQ